MNSTIRNAMLAAGALVLGATTAGASPSTVFEGNVPVPFVINGTMFPAGKYIVLGESSSLLLIRGVHDAGRSCGQVPESDSAARARRRHVPGRRACRCTEGHRRVAGRLG